MDKRQLEELTEEALEALQRGDSLRAVAITDQLTAVVPDDPVVRAIRAEALLKTGTGEEALTEAQRAVELDPDNDRGHTLLGLAAWRVGRLTLAQHALERAIELSGGKSGVLADYAWFMASERGPRLAEQAANEAVAANHKSSTAWAALGLAQFRLHRRRAAEASLSRALQLDPNDPYAQSVMATLLHAQRKDSGAVALTDLLEDTPGTEAFVQRIRGEARKRQIERELIERRAVREPTYQESPRQFWLWLIVAVMTIAGLIALAFALPQLTPEICLWGLMLLVMLWVLRKFFD
jgi:Tfp pilus assembly protein PilF